ncbi:galactose-3-O-sulfotransferase 2-like [Styela clava]|uniref:galactose-3-O-sulfotransferase 2-like n=1 Tax=Styela clava TaxID=7725 RepID=UPI001939C012|nr:galactose-3-O-sulfotransferase 2-like [Styela clava]
MLQSMRKPLLILILLTCIAVIPYFLYLDLYNRNLRSIRIELGLDWENYGRAMNSTTSIHCRNGPKRNLMFLKTHKTGSSTLQNILVRFAYDNDRFVGLPTGGDILFGYYSGTPFKKSMMMPVPKSRNVNMLLHHMVFNKKEIASVLPSDTVYLTILRDPATQFESVFHYLRKDVPAFSRASGENGLTDYVRNPTQYFKGRGDGRFWWFGKNGMFFDLGFDNLSENDTYINEAIDEIEKTFDIVLISEFFDISLLLLRDLLCWDMKDIIYLSMNARNQSTVEHVTADVKDLIYKWNKADWALYNHYNKTFWRQVENYGKHRLENDLTELNRLKKEIANFCVEDNLQNNRNIRDNTYKMFNPDGIEVTQYILKKQAKNSQICQGLIYPELVWHKKLVNKQDKPPATKSLWSRLPSSMRRKV